MTTTQDEFIPTRQSLLSRLKDWDDQISWQQFFDTYWKLIYSVARQAGLPDAEAQDVVQETIITVAKKMPHFQYDPALGSFKSWLMLITRRRIQNQMRKKQYKSHGKRLPREETLSTNLAESLPDTSAFDLEKVWNAEWAKNLTETAMARVRQNISPQQYQAFYLHVCKRMSVRDVAQRLEVKLAEVYFAKYKVSRLIQKQIKLLEAKIL